MYVILEIIQTICYLIYCIIEATVRIFVPEKKKSFAGKLVLVTGAGHGIGRELSLKFSAIGARLVLWDINKDNVESVVREIQENGGTATSYICDVSKIDEIKSVADKVRREIGDVDALVNNAGILHGAAFLTLTDEEIKRTIDINLLAYFWTCRQFLPPMINRNSGHIVNVASMAAKKGVAYLTDYAASKHGVEGFTDALSDEMRREGYDGLYFTTVFPMFVDTGMTKFAHDRLSKMLSPAEVASAVVEGVQRNKKSVYIPSNLDWSVRIGGLFPRKFVDEPTDLMYRGIDPQK
ncbi:17-beta-hydroxysteroid dehydrogenase 13-like [Mercenaria mercenaria]|uniref:17-beta-hydroxysteroid dehydrogenase 13-like n=1 Tax=Mercenaria mercenaria TaxID=6596 RepID=UPI00234E66FF|nr:17-beta-hydroxysteroid dehydrogenase 13-like [Mercenaria mercenaria]